MVAIGLHMESGLIDFLIHPIFQETEIHRKYLHISTFDDYIDELDYSKFPFEWLVIDLKEDSFLIS